MRRKPERKREDEPQDERKWGEETQDGKKWGDETQDKNMSLTCFDLKNLLILI